MVIRKRLDISGPALFFVTTTIRNWAHVFDDVHARAVIMTQLAARTSAYHTSLVGYVVMPSHLHLLIGFRVAAHLPVFMQQLKSVSARYIMPVLAPEVRSALGEFSGNSLWQPRYDEVVIFSEDQFRIKLEYIHNNPVKAGLVAVPTGWECSSARDWLCNQAGPIPVCKSFDWLR